MQIDAQTFLRLVETAGTALFFDLETQGLKSDYGKILTYSACWYGGEPFTTTGTEEEILTAMAHDFDEADMVCGYYSKMFDVPFANTRLLELGKPPLAKKPHLDMYFQIKPRTNLTSTSLGSVGALLNLAEEKMKVSPRSWREQDLPVLIQRCESDVRLLMEVYEKTKHLVENVTR